MRIIAFSDSHRALKNIDKLLSLHQNADLFLFLGDMDDDFDYAINKYPSIKYYRVRGNNEFYSSHEYEQVFRAEGKLFFISHGHKYSVKGTTEIISNKAKSINADICLFGHTHFQMQAYDNGLYIVNPGSLYMGDYAIIDIVNGELFVNTTRLK